jgi:hypothetical protein
MNLLIKPKEKKQSYRTIKGVPGKVTTFDKKLHEKYDIPAREALINILGDLVKENEDIYGEDLIFTKENFPYKYLEVQVFSKWETEKFPYCYPFVYSRKMRFSDDTLFITFNKHYTEFIMFDKLSIDKKETRFKKYSREYINLVSWYRAFRSNTSDLTEDNIRLYSGEII